MGVAHLIGHAENMPRYMLSLARWMCSAALLGREMYLKNLRVGVDVAASQEPTVLMRMDSAAPWASYKDGFKRIQKGQ